MNSPLLQNANRNEQLHSITFHCEDNYQNHPKFSQPGPGNSGGSYSDLEQKIEQSHAESSQAGSELPIVLESHPNIRIEEISHFHPGRMIRNEVPQLGKVLSCLLMIPLWNPLLYFILRNSVFGEVPKKQTAAKTAVMLAFLIELYLMFHSSTECFVARYVWNMGFITFMDGLTFQVRQRKKDPVHEFGKRRITLKEGAQMVHSDYTMFVL